MGHVDATEFADLLRATCPTLSELTLHGALSLADCTLSDLAHFATNLRYLSLAHCQFEGFFHLAFGVLWSKLIKLQHLGTPSVCAPALRVAALCACVLP